MEEWMNDESILGIVYFVGGHTEEILYYNLYGENYIVFVTDSGTYRYRNFGRSTFDYMFEKRVEGQWIYACIERISVKLDPMLDGQFIENDV